MSARFYRHDIGFTEDQRRADRQIRVGLTGAYVALGCVVIVQLLSSELLPGVWSEEIKVSVLGVLGAGAAFGLLWAFLVAALRSRLVRHHPAHTHLTAWVVALVPGSLLVGWLVAHHLAQSHLAAQGITFLSLALLATLAIAVLNRLRLLGHQATSRVLIIDLEQRTRTWHSKAEVEALDEAAEAAAAGIIPEQPRAGHGDWRL